ncbi:hypothetical protein ACIBFB_17595 [Nocardiopsis sp. NPDC050513]|uniref:hypothetical protein n=1 Tax=Nocardiopsis sp. NPDC050513 TaxID=3364338 RepID=UPI0037A8B46B
MQLKSPRSPGYETWLLMASYSETPNPDLELELKRPDGVVDSLHIASGDSYIHPASGLILGFHVRYADGSGDFFALDHSGPEDWYEKRAALNEVAHIAWDVASIGKMILARTPAKLAAAGVGYVVRHTGLGETVREAVVSVLPDWTGSPPDPGYYRQSDGAYMIRGAYHLSPN